ncbi:large-conductance mechanosensitive channel [Liquorilactobacillus hordei DSM 19519]|uniref:Large-conductance mechanosensitive channel n=1 Tax=Liquorilactobacillus hordei DSM 19519 TaxID=1423759 RepID=A0A0R1MPW4_9LACO|nr:large-conductance mechanosensitive channel [Liquorilactobacillus hordei DSM 19519]
MLELIKEFKEFISRGNVIDLAVGVIIGGAFTSIVKSLVDYIINPFIGLFIGGIDFSDLVFKVNGATFKFGSFINAVINFLIIAFVVFLLVKFVNRFLIRKKKEEVVAVAAPEVKLLEEIRDLLKTQEK